MPHITIEYSANVGEYHDIGRLVDVVHAAALDDGLAPLDGLRTRAVSRDHYRVADGQPDHAFIAIAARIGPGRDLETKQTFIRRVLDAAEHHLEQTPSPLSVAWSIEIIEIDAATRLNRNHVRTRMQGHQEDDR